MAKKVFSIRLEPTLKRELEKIAGKEDRTVSYITERAIRREVAAAKATHGDEAAA